MTAYEQALSQVEPSRNQSEDVTDSDVLLRITDPANKTFWEWKELPAMASIDKGSRTVQTSSAVGAAVRKGTQVRIGEHFVTTAQGPGTQTGFEVADVPPAGIDEPILEGQLFKKIHKTRVTKDIVPVVFNLALLQEKRGHHEAAQELHKAVLAEHPTYIHSTYADRELHAEKVMASCCICPSLMSELIYFCPIMDSHNILINHTFIPQLIFAKCSRLSSPWDHGS